MLRIIFIAAIIAGVAYGGFTVMQGLFSGPGINRRQPVTAGGADLDPDAAEREQIRPLTEVDPNDVQTPEETYGDDAGGGGY